MWCLWTGLAFASPAVEVGLGGRVAVDQDDGVYDFETARFGPGPGAEIPLRISLGHGAWLRGTLAGATAVGHDRVMWSEGPVRYESHGHAARYTATWLLAGPELRAPVWERVQPILGLDLGAAWVQNWHGFEGATQPLVAEDDGAHPFSDVWVPAMGGHLGLRLGISPRVAVELESGYTVSFLNQVPLRKAPEDLQAVRASYGLNVAHLGVAATFGFGKVEPAGVPGAPAPREPAAGSQSEGEPPK